MGHCSLRRCVVVCVLVLATGSASTPTALADEGPQILVSFDEIGSLPCASISAGAIDVYVTAHGIEEIAGYEFELAPTVLPSFFLDKTLYQAGQLELGIELNDYEVRAATYDCITDPTLVGPSPWSWTLVRYQLGYFAGIGNDIYICLRAAPSSGVQTPVYTLCDPMESQVPFSPLPWDLSGVHLTGCAVANPTMRCESVVGTGSESWGTLKSQYR